MSIVVPLLMVVLFGVALAGIIGWVVPVFVIAVLSSFGLWHSERRERHRRRSQHP